MTIVGNYCKSRWQACSLQLLLVYTSVGVAMLDGISVPPTCFPICIELFTTRHKVVHNAGSPKFKGSLFNKKTTYMAQILQSLSNKVCFIILPKFNKFGLLILILGTSAIMDQTAC